MFILSPPHPSFLECCLWKSNYVAISCICNCFQNVKPAAYSQIEENELDNEGEQDSEEEDEEN